MKWRKRSVRAAVCAVIFVLVADRAALAAATEVDARSAHRAVWRVHGAGRAGGTAFAIGERHFLTCAHVIKYYSGHGATEVFLDRHGSKDTRRLRVNWSHVAMTLVQDIALFTTKETVNHMFALAPTSAGRGEWGLRAMGHPEGLPLETLHQTDPVTYRDEYHLEIPTDKITRGGLSGSPVFGDDGKVVGMHCQGSDNMAIAVKVELLRRFLDGDLAWTACKDLPSVAACIERATVQARELAASGDRVAQYQLGRDDGHLDKNPAMLRRVQARTLLHLQRQRVHPPAHVRHPCGQPHPNTARNRNHRRPTTATTRASAGACTVASTMTRTSSPSTISIRPGAASLDGSGASTTTGTNPAPVSAGVRYRRRHLNNTLV